MRALVPLALALLVDQRLSPFCGGPMNVPCTNGMQCVDFSTKLKVAIAGACAG